MLLLCLPLIYGARLRCCARVVLVLCEQAGMWSAGGEGGFVPVWYCAQMLLLVLSFESTWQLSKCAKKSSIQRTGGVKLTPCPSSQSHLLVSTLRRRMSEAECRFSFYFLIFCFFAVCVASTSPRWQPSLCHWSPPASHDWWTPFKLRQVTDCAKRRQVYGPHRWRGPVAQPPTFSTFQRPSFCFPSYKKKENKNSRLFVSWNCGPPFLPNTPILLFLFWWGNLWQELFLLTFCLFK